LENLQIIEYNKNDNLAALELESLCPQGKSIQIKFNRPSFHLRSEVYDNYKIFCAKYGNRLIGILAGAEKFIKLNNKIIRAIYLYDLRVHPDYRKSGIAKLLTIAVLNEFGNNIDCVYTFVAGKNKRALDIVQRGFGADIVVPLTYTIFPVYRKFIVTKDYKRSGGIEARDIFSNKKKDVNFIPKFNENKMNGYLTNISIRDEASTSIWSNENILAEQIVKIPMKLRALSIIQKSLNPIIKLPEIPKKNEIIKSWFLFDLYSENDNKLKELLAVTNNLAFEQNYKYIYILLQNRDPLLASINKLGLKKFTLPYFLLAKGKYTPYQSDQIYIDVRDL